MEEAYNWASFSTFFIQARTLRVGRRDTSLRYHYHWLPRHWNPHKAPLASSLRPTHSPLPNSQPSLQQTPLPDNMLFSHIILTPTWEWVWALLPILATYSVFSRVRTWLRLRHIPGPPFAAWSKVWLLSKALGGRFHLDTAEVCEKYGQCRRRTRNGKESTS